MTNCVCGSNSRYENCCGLFITGEQLPATPEQLMRSRYTAFTQANVDYIERTMCGAATQNFNPEATQSWAQQVEWLGLQIINVLFTAENSEKGTVEFIACYREQGKMQSIHEISEFQRQKGCWFYTGAQPGKPSRKINKIGRNDPCLCGSGRKYKKCCGQ